MGAPTNIYPAGRGFKILHATRRSWTASMTLDPSESSSEKPNTHPESDQVPIVLEGTVTAEISGKGAEMEKGDTGTIPAGTPHKFTNAGSDRSATFSCESFPSSPPAYR
jgi:mannose-6-phosphate isomerase-like protein (cupin superfamily)